MPGGGTALVYASRTLESVKEKCENFDQKVHSLGLSFWWKDLRHDMKPAEEQDALSPLLMMPSHRSPPVSTHLPAFQPKPLAELTFLKVGVEIIQRAIRRPAKTIANNAGLEGDVIVGKLLEKVGMMLTACGWHSWLHSSSVACMPARSLHYPQHLASAC